MEKICLGVALLSVVACTTDTRSSLPVSTVVSAELGGTVSLGANEVVIPALALTSDVEITLSTELLSGFPELANGQAQVLVIEPEGTLLERAASVTLSVVGATEGARVSVMQLFEGDGVANWSPVSSEFLASESRVVASITRFAPLAVVVENAVVVTPGSNTITGVISWGDGSPVEGAPIDLLMGGSPLTQVLSGADGSFTIADLSAGSYTLEVSYECDLTEMVEVTNTAPTVVELTLCGL